MNRRIREHPRMVITAPIQGMSKVDDMKVLRNARQLVLDGEIEKVKGTVCH